MQKDLTLPVYMRVTTLEHVLSELGEDDDDVKEYRALLPVSAKKYTIANVVLTMVAKVYNRYDTPPTS